MQGDKRDMNEIARLQILMLWLIILHVVGVYLYIHFIKFQVGRI